MDERTSPQPSGPDDSAGDFHAWERQMKPVHWSTGHVPYVGVTAGIGVCVAALFIIHAVAFGAAVLAIAAVVIVLWLTEK